MRPCYAGRGYLGPAIFSGSTVGCTMIVAKFCSRRVQFSFYNELRFFQAVSPSFPYDRSEGCNPTLFKRQKAKTWSSDARLGEPSVFQSRRGILSDFSWT